MNRASGLGAGWGTEFIDKFFVETCGKSFQTEELGQRMCVV